MNKSVAVIGSGLAAIAACKALIKKGIKPIVIDIGNELPDKNKQASFRMSQSQSVNWRPSDRELIMHNRTLKGLKSPKKLLFGSDYFYGKPEEALISCDKPEIECPPFSYAKGGFSAGWGASALLPDNGDLLDWPISSAELLPYFKEVLEDLPYSAKEDDLAINFPLIKNTSEALKLNSGNVALLEALKKSNLLKKDYVVFGQSRNLVNSSNCQYCGTCISGCVYDAIYKSNHDLDKLIKSNLIEYKPGIHVDTIKDGQNKSTLFYKDSNGDLNHQTFSRILLAAGAVNSTAIVMKSKSLYDIPVTVKTTLGFVVPMFHLKALPTDWPNSNTLSGIFLEFKTSKLSPHWIHSQLSTPNELVLSKLGIGFNKNKYLNLLKIRLSKHLVMAHCNIHSLHANHYYLELKKNTGKAYFKAQREEAKFAQKAVNIALNELARISRAFGCYVIKPFVMDNTKSHGYHLGASMPMKVNQKSELDTDRLGRPLGWKNTHVIDSSIFPSIPATTMGLLSMANATRIVNEMEI